MSYQRTILDAMALPTEMLPLAKSHMRVLFSDDDDYITRLLSGTIDLFERLTGFWVTASTITWVPDDSAGGNGSGGGGLLWGSCVSCEAGICSSDGASPELPFGPANAVTAKDKDGVDVSGNYLILGNQGTGQYTPQRLGMKQTGLVDQTAPIDFTFTVGFADLDALPPSLLNLILRMTAWLYEQREMAAMEGVDVMPYANSLLSGWWVPRC